MFDFARAYVAAIADAKAKEACHCRKNGVPSASSADDLELPRFLADACTCSSGKTGATAADESEHLWRRLAGALQRRASSYTAQLRDFSAACVSLCAPVIAGHAGLVSIVTIAGFILLFLAGAAPGSTSRNPSADAIATRFAAASGDLADLEERLDFAPRLAVALSARDSSKVQIAMTADAVSRTLPFDALGAVVLRGLPDGTSLSQGLPLGNGQWAVAQGDLDNLEVSIPNLTKAAEVVVDVVGRDGVVRGSVTFTLTPTGVMEAKLDGASAIRTGALNPPQANARPAATEGKDKARRSSAGKAPVRRKARNAGHGVVSAPNAVKLQFKPVNPATQQLPGSPVLLFKPAGETPEKPRRPSQKQAALPKKDASFPRSPMEEEAARR